HEAARRRLARRTGSQVRDVECLPEPVLARRVPDRQSRLHPQRALRRGRVRPDRTVDSPAARRAGTREGGARRYDANRADDTRDLARLRAPALELRWLEARA